MPEEKLKMYAVPEYIAELTEERVSTWNNGYDDKYLQDQGALYKMISSKFWKLLCLQDALRRRSSYKTCFWTAYKKMLQGGKRFASENI